MTIQQLAALRILVGRKSATLEDIKTGLVIQSAPRTGPKACMAALCKERYAEIVKGGPMQAWGITPRGVKALQMQVALDKIIPIKRRKTLLNRIHRTQTYAESKKPQTA